MTVLIAAALLLSLLVVALLLAPLLRRRRPPVPRDAYDLAVYVAQLAEIDRDLGEGRIGGPEAAAARTEVKRRMLALADAVPAAPPADAAPGAAAPPERRRGRAAIAAAAVAVAVPALAVAVYLAVGSPGSPDRPLAGRQATGDLAATPGPPAEVRAELIETVGRLERFLAERPNEANGWLLLGRAQLTLDRPADAITALERALLLSQRRPDIVAAYAEALIVAAGGRVDERAQTVLAEAVAADPRNIQARFYLALGEAQRGDQRAALQGWVDVLALSPADAPWRPEVAGRVDETAADLGLDAATIAPSAAVQALVAAPSAEAATSGGRPADSGPPGAAGPAAADIDAAAAMTAEERAQMIEGMVERLAQRLQANPDDRDGWLRLARAYDVLGRPAQAAEARARAAALPPR